MKITVLGAAGNMGHRIVEEALSRGHEVTAVVRDAARFKEINKQAIASVGDAGNRDKVIELSTNQDLIINATRPPNDSESEIVATTQNLLEGLAQTGVRVLMVGGAASLTVPGTGGRTVIEDPNYLPVSARKIARGSFSQLDVCRSESRVDWVYLSPPAQLSPGTRTGNFRLGRDELLVDEQGVSKISMEDLAVALMDEAEHPRHHRTRFTAAY